MGRVLKIYSDSLANCNICLAVCRWITSAEGRKTKLKCSSSSTSKKVHLLQHMFTKFNYKNLAHTKVLQLKVTCTKIQFFKSSLLKISKTPDWVLFPATSSSSNLWPLLPLLSFLFLLSVWRTTFHLYKSVFTFHTAFLHSCYPMNDSS